MSALRGHAKGLGLLSGVAGSEDVLEQGIQAVFDIIPRPMNLQEYMASASSVLLSSFFLNLEQLIHLWHRQFFQTSTFRDYF